MGGECNYLLRVGGDARLEFVPDELWKSDTMREWSAGDIGEPSTPARTHARTHTCMRSRTCFVAMCAT